MAGPEYSLVKWLQICEELSMEEAIEAAVQPVRLLDRGGVVAVIGARESNVADYWHNPRCVFMEGDEAASRGLPANARAVVFTRFLGHTAFKAILREARQRHLTAFPVQGTGQLKRTLASLLPMSSTPPATTGDAPAVPTPAPDAPVPEPSMPAPDTSTPIPTEDDAMAKPKPDFKPRGEVTAWVRAHYTPTMPFRDLIRLAEQEHVPFKEATISAAFYAIRRGVPRNRGKAAAVPAVGRPVPVIPDDVQPDELVQLIDDAIAGLNLVREAAIKVSADRAKMAQILALAQQIQGR